MAEKEKALRIMEKAKAEGRKALTETESKEVILSYGIPVTRLYEAKNAVEAGKYAESVGYPIVCKIISPDILHKTDAGGVKLNLKSRAEVERAFEEIVANARRYKPDARIWGVTVQEMAPEGRQVIVGMTKDPQFGPALMFGLGGVFVEVLKDVSFRIAPLTRLDAAEMIKEIKGYPILGAFRGQQPADIDALVDIILKTSQMVTDLKEIAELDLNPIFVYEAGKGAKTVDARVVLS
jgi:acetyl-CoA synthetase (ADP-forming)